MSEEPQEVKEINVSGLHEELVLAGLPVAGVDSRGKISWAEGASGQEKAQAEQVVAQHRGKPARAEQRRAAGITLEALVEALWEKVFLEKDSKAQALLHKIAKIETVE